MVKMGVYPQCSLIGRVSELNGSFFIIQEIFYLERVRIETVDSKMSNRVFLGGWEHVN